MTKEKDTFIEATEDFTLDPERVLAIQFVCEKDEDGNKPKGDDVEGIIVVHMVGGTTLGIEGATRATYQEFCKTINKAVALEQDDRIMGFAQNVRTGGKIGFEQKPKMHSPREMPEGLAV